MPAVAAPVHTARHLSPPGRIFSRRPQADRPAAISARDDIRTATAAKEQTSRRYIFIVFPLFVPLLFPRLSTGVKPRRALARRSWAMGYGLRRSKEKRAYPDPGLPELAREDVKPDHLNGGAYCHRNPAPVDAGETADGHRRPCCRWRGCRKFLPQAEQGKDREDDHDCADEPDDAVHFVNSA